MRVEKVHKKNNNKNIRFVFSTFHLALECKATNKKKQIHGKGFPCVGCVFFCVICVTRVNYGDDVWFDALHIYL